MVDSNFFKVGQWYEVIKSGETWNKWFYNEESKIWSRKEDIVATKFLLLKIFQIENDGEYSENKFENIGKFLTTNGEISFYRLNSAIDDLKPLCPK